MKYSFTVYGAIKPKERPRLGKWGVYTPKSTKASEANIAKTFMTTFAGKGVSINPIELEIKIYLIPSKEIQKNKKKMDLIKTGQLRPEGKRDVDNILKCCMDALNGVLYKDDRQVVKATIEKLYSVHLTECAVISWQVMPKF